ncbi:hypothetical protein IAE37_001668 [Pseudomonas sp. S31]|uniref:type IV toxin-antitoxin system AbiEi family antitoxin n=1 Tax=Pseudomonas sp. S31 TaxID=1564473 RepID=UPI001914C432|nr:type IV toxin-antitoxin system AbiEi family antitoxin [Pseudomonas sp. S31]MBK4999392.1 hypothetical protein [Pseudomonas sp. S31]
MVLQQFARKDYEREVVDALCSAFNDAFAGNAKVRQIPVSASASEAGSAPDALIAIETPSKTLMVCVEIKKSVYPRDIRNAVWKLGQYQRSLDHSCESVGLIAAEALSPGAKQELTSQDIAFFEPDASLYLRHDCWLINVDKAVKRGKKKQQQAVELFTDARASVIHALITRSHEWLSGADLSELAATSPYTCSVVLQELTLREWVESVGSGPGKRRRLVEPGKLLDAWAEHWQARRESRTKWYTFIESPKQQLDQLAERIERSQVDFPWAFTGNSAANLVAPLLTDTQGAEIIVPKGYTDSLAQALGLKPASKGANVILIEREAASLLYRHKQSGSTAWIASAYVLYLDLLDGRGRNPELADHLRSYLETLWARK